ARVAYRARRRNDVGRAGNTGTGAMFGRVAAVTGAGAADDAARRKGVGGAVVADTIATFRYVAVAGPSPTHVSALSVGRAHAAASRTGFLQIADACGRAADSSRGSEITHFGTA